MKDVEITELLSGLLGKTAANSVPNLNPLRRQTASIDPMALTLKFYGYELARSLAAALPVRSDIPARPVGLACKPSTQSDLESDWVAHWCARLGIPVVFHRKLWEFAYVLQAIFENGHLRPGARGLGFGCGQEPLPSLMAAIGIDVTMTDLAPEASASKGWVGSNQHMSSRDQACHSHLVELPTFQKNVVMRWVDMNSIPSDLVGYDFCWSICALEHLGSIAKGLDFIENSLATLRPGGLAVHTTEFNFFDDDSTIDNWPTVLFQKRHFEEIALRLRAAGHRVAPLDFDVGSKPLDRFVDVPPWEHDMTPYQRAIWGGDAAHIKLSIDGYASTCFGLVVVKVG